MVVGIRILNAKNVTIEDVGFHNIDKPLVMENVEDVHLNRLHSSYGDILSVGNKAYDFDDPSPPEMDGAGPGTLRSVNSGEAYGTREPRALGAGGFILKKLSAIIWSIYGKK